eukprot:CAMPEP_0198288366 /NCGR_PEP_ID=MMETSP1449-20131203/6879_1 /TAXON_ID=420275 /ORGANISM="Attheya septentrionalis, Strain CCMP2084" /LENGTH=1055 /DNA_ID=CAMNT_0043986483 /DNA_START=287 /DNA_END=3454 /DNA_ORIENTATION=-
MSIRTLDRSIKEKKGAVDALERRLLRLAQGGGTGSGSSGSLEVENDLEKDADNGTIAERSTSSVTWNLESMDSLPSLLPNLSGDDLPLEGSASLSSLSPAQALIGQSLVSKLLMGGSTEPLQQHQEDEEEEVLSEDDMVGMAESFHEDIILSDYDDDDDDDEDNTMATEDLPLVLSASSNEEGEKQTEVNQPQEDAILSLIKTMQIKASSPSLDEEDVPQSSSAEVEVESSDQKEDTIDALLGKADESGNEEDEPESGYSSAATSSASLSSLSLLSSLGLNKHGGVSELRQFLRVASPSTFLSPNDDDTGRPKMRSSYLDRVYGKGEGISLQDARTFQVEHRLFLKAILHLLAERDLIGFEANADDPNTIKAGPLKKSFKLMRGSAWKIKNVELRKGSFTYCGIDEGGKLQKKVLPLRSSLVTCRAIHQKTALGSGHIFELSVENGPSRLWMTKSADERQSWIRAIHFAMIGGSTTAGGGSPRFYNSSEHSTTDLQTIISPAITLHRRALNQYHRLKTHFQTSQMTKHSYLEALGKVWETSLRVPVQWIREQVEGTATISSLVPEDREQRSISSTIHNFTQDLKRQTVSINGHAIQGDRGHGPEVIIGALSRCILEWNRVAHIASERTSGEEIPSKQVEQQQMSELQAITYARDVLMSYNVRRSKDDMYYAVDTLLGHNPSLILLRPVISRTHENDELNIRVSYESSDLVDTLPEESMSDYDKSGWLYVSPKSSKAWSKRYCVLSNGVLTCYEYGHPKPHRLTSQLSLEGCSTSVEPLKKKSDGGTHHRVSSMGIGRTRPNSPFRRKSRTESPRLTRSHSTGDTNRPLLLPTVPECVLFVQTQGKSKERQFGFASEEELSAWTAAIDLAIQSLSSSSVETMSSVSEFSDTDKYPVAHASGKVKAKTDKVRSYTSGSVTASPVQMTPKRRTSKAAFPFFDAKKESDILSQSNSEATVMFDSTVHVTVEASSMHKIVAAVPTANNSEDIWGTVQTTILQSFVLSGGPNGLLRRGDELVEMKFLKGLVQEDAFRTSSFGPPEIPNNEHSFRRMGTSDI